MKFIKLAFTSFMYISYEMVTNVRICLSSGYFNLDFLFKFLKENIVLLRMLHWQYTYMVSFINITFYEIILSNKRHYFHIIICVLRGLFFKHVVR